DCSPPHFPPSPLVSGIAEGFQNPDGTPTFGLIPTKSYDVSSPVTYLLSASLNGGNTLGLWTLDTSQLSLSPFPTGMPVPTPISYSPPPPAAQSPETSPLITTEDTMQLVNAVLQPNNGLWTVHTTGCLIGGLLRSCLHWFQIDPVA